jgi:hypothetical protein
VGNEGSWNGPAAVTPFGIIPMRESNLPSALWNFWMGHTNFLLTKPAVNLIKATPGVETVDVISPYRFRMAVAEQFEQGAVMRAVEAAVQPQPPPPAEPAKPDPLAAVKALLAKQYKAWAIGGRSDGRHECFGGETRAEVEDKLLTYKGPGIKVVASSWGSK